MLKSVLKFSGLLNQLRACGVSVAASGVKIDAFFRSVAQKLSGEVRGRQQSRAKPFCDFIDI